MINECRRVFQQFLTSHLSRCVNCKQRFYIIRAHGFLSKYLSFISCSFRTVFFPVIKIFLTSFFLQLPAVSTNYRLLFLSLCMLKIDSFLKKIQLPRVKNSVILLIGNAKFYLHNTWTFSCWPSSQVTFVKKKSPEFSFNYCQKEEKYCPLRRTLGILEKNTDLQTKLLSRFSS